MFYLNAVNSCEISATDYLLCKTFFTVVSTEQKEEFWKKKEVNHNYQLIY